MCEEAQISREYSGENKQAPPDCALWMVDSKMFTTLLLQTLSQEYYNRKSSISVGSKNKAKVQIINSSSVSSGMRKKNIKLAERHLMWILIKFETILIPK